MSRALVSRDVSTPSRWLGDRCVVVSLSLLLSGCTTFDHMSPAATLERRSVELRFPSPRTVVANGRTGEEVVWRDVTRISGCPLAVRGDTVIIEVRRWASFGAWQWPSSPVVATVVTDATMDVGTERISAGRTAGFVLGTPVVAVLLFIAFCVSVECFNGAT